MSTFSSPKLVQMMSKASLRKLTLLTAVVVGGLALSGLAVGHVLAQSTPTTYVGCLKESGAPKSLVGQFYHMSTGSTPLEPCDTGDVEVEVGSGAVTELPQNCSTDQLIKWDGSAWVCTNKPASIIAKDAIIGGGNTQNTTSSSPVALNGTTVSFSASEIPVDSKLVINWSGRFANSTAGLGSGVATHVRVDGVEVVGTHINEPLVSGWVQHTASKVVPVTAGAHTVDVTWNVFGTGQAGTGTSADTQMVVTAIPN